jgi:hypothetical protein
MEHGKRPTLPRGLRWDPRSPHICFSWRDERGRQHQQSTYTEDPAKALAYKQDFQKENRETINERRARTEDQGRVKDGSQPVPGTIRRAGRRSIAPKSLSATSACFRIMVAQGEPQQINGRRAMSGMMSRQANLMDSASLIRTFPSNSGI